MTQEDAPPPSKRRRTRWLIAASVLLITVLVGTALAAVLWGARSERGTAWLLARLTQTGIVQVSAPRGSLVGDFNAQQLVVHAGGVSVVIDQPAWRALSVSYNADPGMWIDITVQRFSAERVIVTTRASNKPFALPAHMQLPLALRIDALQIAEVQLPGLGSTPLRELSARLQLGAEHGSQHRVDGLHVRLSPLAITGQLQLGARSTMLLDGQLQAVQTPAASVTLPPWAKALRNDWQAQLQVHGPLAGFDARLTLRAQGQQLDASALVAANERWPLPRLQAQTQGLDLSALFERAPHTALQGSIAIAPAAAGAAPPLSVHVDVRNERPGRWNEQHLPLRSLILQASAGSNRIDALEVTRFEAQLADDKIDAGSLRGHGRWDAQRFELQAELDQLRLGTLDPRLAAMKLSGPLALSGSVQPLEFKALIDLQGQLDQPARAVQLRLQASGNAQTIELQELRAAAGAAYATLSGSAQRANAAWQIKAQARLANFDPQPWFPGLPSTAWQAGPHRLNLQANAALQVPEAAAAPAAKGSLIDRLAGVRGDASLQLTDSMLAGVPVTASITARHVAPAETLLAALALEAGGNKLHAQMQLAPDARGAKDRWTLDADAPALARLAPLLRLLPALTGQSWLDGLSGTLNASAQAQGRGAELTTQGKLSLSAVRAGPWSVGQGEANWQLGGRGDDAPLDLQVNVGQAAFGAQQLGASMLRLKGNAHAHDLAVRAELKAAPPAWVDSWQGRSAPAGGALPHTLIEANAHGSLSRIGTAAPWSWQGELQRLEVRSSQAGAAPLLSAKEVGIEVQGGAAPRLSVNAAHADVLGAGLRWDRIEWQAGNGVQTQHLSMNAQLEPFAVAPLLRRLQPNFGWGGDLQIAGKVVIRQASEFSADIVLERTQGDLSVTDEAGTRALGLTDLRLGLNAQNGVWNFTQGLAGHYLGVAAGALIVHTAPMLAWPASDAPVQGVLDAQVANLGVWGAWVPAGWRLDGQLRTTASIGGKFSAIEYTGAVTGHGIGVRNVLQGVAVTDGELDVTLQGNSAKINKLEARSGAGSVHLEGEARLDESWRAQLQLAADKFQVLGRVDRRIVASGNAQVKLDAKLFQAEGEFRIDEGLIDFSRANAPTLSDDVTVVGRSAQDEAPNASSAPVRNTLVNLQLSLGDHLRVRGHGLDSLLRGDLKLTMPNGKFALHGTVNAADGTYRAYSQNLVIDRGLVSFNGTIENPRVDIEATRPNLDVRVGVAISGLLQSLRVRLFSEPDMSDADKLSWLVLGRASDGLGRSDAALVQGAAFALLAGEGGGGVTDITKAIGLDEVSLHQTDTDTRETVVAVGKQISRRVFVGYEQNLNTSTGSLQVTYRIAQRFVMRFQSGLDRSIDILGTWRWE